MRQNRTNKLAMFPASWVSSPNQALVNGSKQKLAACGDKRSATICVEALTWWNSSSSSRRSMNGTVWYPTRRGTQRHSSLMKWIGALVFFCISPIFPNGLSCTLSGGQPLSLCCCFLLLMMRIQNACKQCECYVRSRKRSLLTSFEILFI